jgi:hypothetical protein
VVGQQRAPSHETKPERPAYFGGLFQHPERRHVSRPGAPACAESFAAGTIPTS